MVTQTLPCPVRLKLPPTQSALDVQSCIPLSCKGTREWGQFAYNMLKCKQTASEEENRATPLG